MPLEPVTFVLMDAVLPFGNPLQEAVVRVYSEDGAIFITEGSTDEDGELVLDLEDMTNFWVRFFKVGFAFNSLLKIAVDSTATSNIFDIVGRDLVELPPSAVPGLCRASGYLVNAAGEPAPGATFSFEATELPKVINGRAVVRSKVISISDAEGYFEVELAQGGVYDVVAEGSEDKVIRVKVPDSQAVDITHLVWPFVASFYWDPAGPISLDIDESIEVFPHIVLSSGVETPYELDNDDLVNFGNYVDLKSSNEEIVTITREEKTDRLTLVGKSLGTTTLSVTLKPDIEAIRLPAPIRDLQDLVVTVA